MKFREEVANLLLNPVIMSEVEGTEFLFLNTTVTLGTTDPLLQ